jgi:hypothetical protein
MRNEESNGTIVFMNEQAQVYDTNIFREGQTKCFVIFSKAAAKQTDHRL